MTPEQLAVARKERAKRWATALDMRGYPARSADETEETGSGSTPNDLEARVSRSLCIRVGKMPALLSSRSFDIQPLPGNVSCRAGGQGREEVEGKRATRMITVSTLICPHCGEQTTHTMPTNACVVVTTCRTCAAVLRPKSGDCCVFCSYGDVPCPPMQQSAQATL
jgi:hypothetical protein